MTRDEVLAAVAARVSYLRASADADGDDWWRCDTLVSEPTALVDVVRATRDGFATDDDGVAASLFTQAYAFRVAGVALAAYALGLPVPDTAPAVTAVRLDKPRPSAVAYRNPAVRALGADELAAQILEGHLRPFVESVHASFTVGERLLWGDAAASCAAAFRAVESSGVDPAPVRDRADAFVDAAATWFAGLGAFTLVERGARAAGTGTGPAAASGTAPRAASYATTAASTTRLPSASTDSTS